MPSEKFHIGLGYNYKTRTDMATYKAQLPFRVLSLRRAKCQKLRVGIALSQPHTGATTIMLNLSTKLYEF